MTTNSNYQLIPLKYLFLAIFCGTDVAAAVVTLLCSCCGVAIGRYGRTIKNDIRTIKKDLPKIDCWQDTLPTCAPQLAIAVANAMVVFAAVAAYVWGGCSCRCCCRSGYCRIAVILVVAAAVVVFAVLVVVAAVVVLAVSVTAIADSNNHSGNKNNNNSNGSKSSTAATAATTATTATAIVATTTTTKATKAAATGGGKDAKKTEKGKYAACSFQGIVLLLSFLLLVVMVMLLVAEVLLLALSLLLFVFLFLFSFLFYFLFSLLLLLPILILDLANTWMLIMKECWLLLFSPLVAIIGDIV